MKKCHCLFFKRDNKITALYKGNSGIEVLRFRGEISVEYTNSYWNDWKNYSGYCKGDMTDFCFIYDAEMELPEEYRTAQCDINESIWTVEKIKGVSSLLDAIENIDIYDESNQYILTITNSVRKTNKIVMFSKNINKSDVIDKQEEEGELTPFIQYYVDKAKGE